MNSDAAGLFHLEVEESDFPIRLKRSSTERGFFLQRPRPFFPSLNGDDRILREITVAVLIIGKYVSMDEVGFNVDGRMEIQFCCRPMSIC